MAWHWQLCIYDSETELLAARIDLTRDQARILLELVPDHPSVDEPGGE